MWDRADLRAFPVARWAAAARSAGAALSVADLGYPDPAGHQALREVLAEYLTRGRGAQADPGQLTICASATDGIGRIRRLPVRGGAAAGQGLVKASSMKRGKRPPGGR
jgi:DNA-binding transcriptional MocR family regulator